MVYQRDIYANKMTKMRQLEEQNEYRMQFIETHLKYIFFIKICVCVCILNAEEQATFSTSTLPFPQTPWKISNALYTIVGH